MPTLPPYLASFLVMTIVVAFGNAAAAESQVVELKVVFHSGVRVADQKRDTLVYDATAGSVAHFSVTAVYDDGSTRDVTSDPALQVAPLSPLLQVDEPGRVVFALGAGRAPAGFSLRFGGREKLSSFVAHAVRGAGL